MPQTNCQSNALGEGTVLGSYSSLRQHQSQTRECRSETEDVNKAPTVQPTQVEDMAYCLHKDGEFEDDQPDHGSVSLAGIIKLQPNRRKGNKSWRTMQASDMREPVSVGCDTNFHLGETEVNGQLPLSSTLQYSFNRSHTATSASLHIQSNLSQAGDACEGPNDTDRFAVFAQAGDKGNRLGEMHCVATEPHVQLFGQLPDPIRLHEQMGEFDGQVVFIGHPNRDISAHQWSSSSFQWVNIGRYAHSRGKVEGSLASDRLRGVDESRHTLEYFKMAAENRETLIIHHGRPKEHATTAGYMLHADANVVVPTLDHKDTSLETSRFSANTQDVFKPILPSTAHPSTRKDTPEDPFIAATSANATRSADTGKKQGESIGLTGLLDLTYQFPTKANPVRPAPNVRAGTFDRRSTEGPTLNFLSAPSLHEVAFGEEAGTQRVTTPTNHEWFQGLHSGTFQKSVQGRSQPPGNVDGPQPNIPVQDNATQSITTFSSATRYALPTHSATPLGYVASNLSATAGPYDKQQIIAVESGASASNTSTVNVTAVGLHYSDPDGLRQTQKYEVTNGLGQQAPTPQSFKGPFFTESKPTTHDLTVALTVRINEEEKLMNWFRDGHRPARQKEYTKSLIAAAVASGKGRYLGAVGEIPTVQERGPYANTAPFVRLYENLSEYVEEYRNGSGQSYFTRRWKPAALHQRDSSPDGNLSYFNRRAIVSMFSRGLLRPSEHIWG